MPATTTGCVQLTLHHERHILLDAPCQQLVASTFSAFALTLSTARHANTQEHDMQQAQDAARSVMYDMGKGAEGR